MYGKPLTLSQRQYSDEAGLSYVQMTPALHSPHFT